MLHAPLVEMDMTQAAYKVTMPDGMEYLVPYQAWMEMLGHSTPSPE